MGRGATTWTILTHELHVTIMTKPVCVTTCQPSLVAYALTHQSVFEVLVSCQYIQLTLIIAGSKRDCTLNNTSRVKHRFRSKMECLFSSPQLLMTHETGRRFHRRRAASQTREIQIHQFEGTGFDLFFSFTLFVLLDTHNVVPEVLSHCFVCLTLASHFGVKSHRHLFCIWSLFLSLLGYVVHRKLWNANYS
jgi:hypothetical protein